MAVLPGDVPDEGRERASGHFDHLVDPASRAITLNGGYSSSKPPVAHFGLGRVTVGDLEITLPGRTEPLVLPGTKANQLYRSTAEGQ